MRHLARPSDVTLNLFQDSGRWLSALVHHPRLKPGATISDVPAGLWQELPRSAKAWIPTNESPLSAGREGPGVSPNVTASDLTIDEISDVSI